MECYPEEEEEVPFIEESDNDDDSDLEIDAPELAGWVAIEYVPQCRRAAAREGTADESVCRPVGYRPI